LIGGNVPLAAVDPLNQSLVKLDSNARCRSSSVPNGSLLANIAILLLSDTDLGLPPWAARMRS
jgi:hypothetical protein